MDSQKGNVRIRLLSRTRTETGDTKRISWPRAWLPSCQTRSHNITDQRRSLGGRWSEVWEALRDKVKFISRKRPAYGGRILLI